MIRCVCLEVTSGAHSPSPGRRVMLTVGHLAGEVEGPHHY